MKIKQKLAYVGLEDRVFMNIFIHYFVIYLTLTNIGYYIFWIHGGIISGLSIETFKNTYKLEEFSLIGGVLWGDPSDDISYFKHSQRGAVYLYGKNTKWRRRKV